MAPTRTAVVTGASSGITFATTRPSHVNIDSLVVLARDRAGARTVHRRPS
jgi:NAD(P)-dependent dehydrogenase (short-subunit alcohol dehydrogenase family)